MAPKLPKVECVDAQIDEARGGNCLGQWLDVDRYTEPVPIFDVDHIGTV